MAREFEELTLDGHNYLTWAMDVKISLAFWGILVALSRPDEREVSLTDQYKYNTLYIIRHHIHPDLKAEYTMKEEPSVLWLSLKTDMSSKRQSFCLRPIMNRLTFISRILNSLETITMLFTKSVPSYIFVRKSHRRLTRYRKLSKQCFLSIGSYNTNTALGITKTILTSYMIYFKRKSMMNSLWRIIANVLLDLLLC